jgi:transposase-like protein
MRRGVAKMTKSKRGRYTPEFKQEAVRLVESGQSQAAGRQGKARLRWLKPEVNRRGV